MLPTQTLIKNIKKVKKLGFENLVQEAVKESDDMIIALNTDDQLYNKGINNDGSKVEPAYTRTTVSIKKKKGQPSNRVTLKDTGDFHDSFKVKASRGEVEIYATDKKAAKLEKKYGDKIYGLTSENRDKYSSEILYPIILKNLKKLAYNGL